MENKQPENTVQRCPVPTFILEDTVRVLLAYGEMMAAIRLVRASHTEGDSFLSLAKAKEMISAIQNKPRPR